MSGVKELSTVLSEIWDRTHHIFPAKRSRTILQWMSQIETVDEAADQFESFELIYPVYWKDDGAAPDPAKNAVWAQGVWS